MWSKNIAPLILSLGTSTGKRSTSRPGHFIPSKVPPETTEWEAELAPEPAWILWKREKSPPLAGIRTTDHPARSLVTKMTTLPQPHIVTFRYLQ